MPWPGIAEASTPTFEPPHWSERTPFLVAARNFKMARSAHAYVRGSTRRFYEWLDSVAPDTFPQGPPIWICGDCHLSNLGPVANAAGVVDIQVRDFDQTVIGNPAHDLIRLGLSLAMAARGSDLPGVTTARMIEALVGGYTHAFSARKDSAIEKPAVVAVALHDAQRRTWRHLAEERIAGRTARLPAGKRFWSLSQLERSAIQALFRSPEVRSLATSLERRDDDAEVRVVDAAYWMKGCSSLGALRYAVLVDVQGQARGGRDLCLIDIKEARRAAAPVSEAVAMPADHAERVVAGARAMSPHLGQRMVASRFVDRPVTLRELLPQDLKLEIARMDADQAVVVAGYVAFVLGQAHARQMSRANRRDWVLELQRDRAKRLDAPSWLWTSVVELVGSHERAYLDHCRRYALDPAMSE